jgi:hypothetical protein
MVMIGTHTIYSMISLIRAKCHLYCVGVLHSCYIRPRNKYTFLPDQFKIVSNSDNYFVVSLVDSNFFCFFSMAEILIQGLDV